MTAGLLIAASLPALLGISYCSPHPQMGRKQDMAEAVGELDLLRQRTGLVVPSSVRLSHFEHHPVRDEMLRAKLVVSASALESFLRDNGFQEAAFTAQNRGFLGVDDGEWDPQQHPVAVLAPPRQDTTGLYVGIRRKGAEAQLYILWFTT